MGGTIHGHRGSDTATYQSWASMKTRCYNPKNKSYEHYGGRGITVCDRWLKFENFLEDMGERPGGMSIDRVDTSLGYYPENCRWATQKQQQRNRSDNWLIEYNGQKRCLSEWSELLGINRHTLTRRLKSWSVERAFTAPLIAPAGLRSRNVTPLYENAQLGQI